MIRQISIFAENRKGAMFRITKVLADADVNMNTLITNDSAEFGIIRMLVDDTDKAAGALRCAEYLCHVDHVAAAEISDECGSLSRLLEALDQGNISLDYLYVTYSTLSKRPVAIIKSVDLMEVEDFLRAQGFDMLNRLD